MHGTVFAEGTRLLASTMELASARLDLAPKITISNKIIYPMNLKWKHFWLLFNYESL